MTIEEDRIRGRLAIHRRISLSWMLGLLVVGALYAPPLSARETQRRESSSQQTARSVVWSGEQWTIRGRSVERGHGWLAVDDALASSRGPAPRWDLRADRFVAWIDSPLRLGAFYARGDIRVIGERPIFVAGRLAVTFRPARRLAVVDGESEPELVGSGWRWSGRRIEVDLGERTATVVGLGATTSL